MYFAGRIDIQKMTQDCVRMHTCVYGIKGWDLMCNSVFWWQKSCVHERHVNPRLCGCDVYACACLILWFVYVKIRGCDECVHMMHHPGRLWYKCLLSHTNIYSREKITASVTGITLTGCRAAKILFITGKSAARARNHLCDHRAL